MDPQHRLITDYLRTHPGDLCVACLAQAIGLPPSQISMARHRLNAAGGFRAVRATCSACRSTRIVLKSA